MLKLQGKYNTAKVFTGNIDNETIGQVIQLMNMPYMQDCVIRIMPDCHAGKGCVVGTTIKFTNKVVPNLVGVDIGCGMYAVRLQEKEVNLEKLDNVINNSIPSGFNIRKNAITGYSDGLSLVFAPIDTDRARKSIGTLGGGNHFIELNKDAEGNIWVVIHTGSRHLGLEICNFYQEQAIKYLTSKTKNEKEGIITSYRKQGRESEIQSALNKLNGSIPDALCYLEEGVSGLFENYLSDMKIATHYASLNRQVIFSEIQKFMGWKSPVKAFHTVHNYIDVENRIVRKGAVSANTGELLIIPINMRDGSLICIGKGNHEWNYSAPHGAGRVLSRGQAKDTLSMKEFEDTMEGIYSSSVLRSTLDEAPMAYKPMKDIVDNIGGTVDVIDVIKPIYNFKAH